MKGNGGGNYWKELLDRIRDIRFSEKVLYRQVLDLYSTSVDYNPHSEEFVRFFKIVQNKLHYATHFIYVKISVLEEVEAKEYRANFTLAHEFFHYIQCQVLGFSFEEVDPCLHYVRAEWQADEFAG